MLLRRPWIVTVSVAAATSACSESQPKATITPEPTPSSAKAPAEVPSGAPAAPPAPSTTRDEPWPFEKEDGILNPKVDGRVVFAGGGKCWTMGAENEMTSGIQFARQWLPCPDGAAETLAKCPSGLLREVAGTCSCQEVEGNPPRPPETVPCPTD